MKNLIAMIKNHDKLEIFSAALNAKLIHGKSIPGSQEFNINFRSKEQFTLLEYAIFYNRMDIVDYLLDCGAQSDFALHVAADHKAYLHKTDARCQLDTFNVFFHLLNKLPIEKINEQVNRVDNRVIFTPSSLFHLVVCSKYKRHQFPLLLAKMDPAEVNTALLKQLNRVIYKHSLKLSDLGKIAIHQKAKTIKLVCMLSHPDVLKSSLLSTIKNKAYQVNIDPLSYLSRQVGDVLLKQLSPGDFFPHLYFNKHLSEEERKEVGQLYTDLMVVADQNATYANEFFIDAVIRLFLDRNYFKVISHESYWIDILKKAIQVAETQLDNATKVTDLLYANLANIYLNQYHKTNDNISLLDQALKVLSKSESPYCYLTPEENYTFALHLSASKDISLQKRALMHAHHCASQYHKNGFTLLARLLQKDLSDDLLLSAAEINHDDPALNQAIGLDEEDDQLKTEGLITKKIEKRYLAWLTENETTSELQYAQNSPLFFKAEPQQKKLAANNDLEEKQVIVQGLKYQ